MSQSKTNAMLMLDRAHIPYQTYHYDASDGQIDGISVAQKVGMPAHSVYKTLLTIAPDGGVYVLIIPVAREMDLKLCASVFQVKNLTMLPVAKILAVSGYVRGGCSPIGMKRHYPTLLDQSADDLNLILVSAGRIGSQIGLSPLDLCTITQARYAPLCR